MVNVVGIFLRNVSFRLSFFPFVIGKNSFSPTEVLVLCHFLLTRLLSKGGGGGIFGRFGPFSNTETPQKNQGGMFEGILHPKLVDSFGVVPWGKDLIYFFLQPEILPLQSKKNTLPPPSPYMTHPLVSRTLKGSYMGEGYIWCATQNIQEAHKKNSPRARGHIRGVVKRPPPPTVVTRTRVGIQTWLAKICITKRP